jgi:hypothetical protein
MGERDTCIVLFWSPNQASNHYFTGWLFSVGTVVDCQFVTIERGFQPTDFLSLDRRRGIGFYVFEGVDEGSCYWYDWDIVDNANIFERYQQDFLGGSWRSSFYLANTSMILSFLLWLYTLSFSCSSQYKGFRYALGGILCIVLVILQSLSFLVLSTNWCDDKNCEFGRAGGYVIGATVCFFLGGACFFVTKDYPGAAPTQQILKDEEDQGVMEYGAGDVHVEEIDPHDMAKGVEEDAPVSEYSPEQAEPTPTVVASQIGYMAPCDTSTEVKNALDGDAENKLGG